ncbi:trypsin-like serine peptidase [Phytohabitans suffuscus]|uniref:Serine protease n=1 Tax=Phytohabitans suffuscus TaxID=624315 RepID=A0A6F8YB72_9ACTN|nr:serine protease [Phytohabitans suffuscus]BCB83279.1 hypothetical protein Psuf_005920 [Phytohabitans suffuscus]
MTDPRRYLALVSTGGGRQSLESAAAAGVSLGPEVRSELLDRVRAEVDYIERVTGEPRDRDVLSAVLDMADEALAKLLGDGPLAQLDLNDVNGLEAVVLSDGSRPVLFVQDDFVDLTAPSIGDYAAPLSRLREQVREVCAGVGRVDDPSAAPLGYQGTAWVVAEGLVVTNYHVLEAIALGGVRLDGQFHGRLRPGVAVHFGHEVRGSRDERRFPIRRVVAVGRAGAPGLAHPDLRGLNFDGLDLAVLELEPVPRRPFPAPVRVARGDDPLTMGGLATAGRGVYLVGYPGQEASTTPHLFMKLFAGVKTFKRLAPGRIMAAAGGVPHDPRGWVLTHDATTLGGNSGSAVVDLDADGRTALALHFAGEPDRRNFAHALERVTNELAGVLPAAAR